MLHSSTGLRPGFAADVLTATRVALAVPLLLAAATGWLPPVVVLLTVAWWTDFFDGRLARTAPGTTRLGAWDPYADAIVAMALLIGLVFSGSPVTSAVIATGLAVAFVARRNVAWGMLLQALAYVVFLTRVAKEAPVWLLLPATTAVVMLVTNRHRFFGEILPEFFRGVGNPRLASSAAWKRWQ